MSYNFPGSDIFPDSLTLPDDSTVPNQANFAPGWEGNRNAAVYNRNHLAASMLANFFPAAAPPSSHNWQAFYFDAGPITSGGSTYNLYNRWRATALNAGTGLKWLISIDGGRTWLTIATTTSAVTPLAKCLVADASFFVHFGSGSVVYYGTSTVNTETSSGWNATQGVAFRNEATNKEYFVGANQTGTTFTGAAASFTASGHVAVNKTSSLPAGWVSGTNHVGTFFAATNPVNNHTFVAMGGVTPGTDTARILYAAFDVTAPSDVTPSLLTGKIITGFTFDISLKVFVLVTWDGANTRIYTLDDPTGVNPWVLVRTTAAQFGDAYAIRGAWAFAFDSDGIIGGATTRTFMITTNKGATFEKAQVDVDLGTTFASAAGYESILGANSGNVYVSLAVR